MKQICVGYFPYLWRVCAHSTQTRPIAISCVLSEQRLTDQRTHGPTKRLIVACTRLKMVQLSQNSQKKKETQISPKIPKNLNAFLILIIMIIMPLAWSQCVRNGHHAFGRDTVPLAGSIPLACMHGDHAFGIITMPLTSSPRLWHGHRAFGMVTASLAWLPRLWHGHRALDMITATEAMVIHDFAVVYDSLLILFSKSAVFFCSLA